MNIEVKMKVRVSIDRVVNIPGNASTADVIAHVIQQISNASQFELRHHGRMLDDQQTLSSAGVQQGDTLELHSAGMTGSPV